MMMTTAALPWGWEKTGWRWEQWLDKVGEFYRNVIWLQEIRRMDDNIIPRSSPQKWTPFWKKEPTPNPDAMEVAQINLSPYERRHHLKENRCFTCHKPRCQPWRHPKGPERRRMAEKENLQTTGPQQTNSPTIPTTSDRSITILAELYYSENGKILEMGTLIDSGAAISCINQHLVNRIKWPLEKLFRPMYARNADGTNNIGGTFWDWITLLLRVQGRTLKETFYVLDLGKRDNIILGYPWLMKNNLQINWGTREVQIIGTPTPCHDDPEIIK